MRGTCDMSNVSEQGTFDIPQPGVYDVEIAEKRDGETKQNLDPMVSIRLIIASGEYQGLWVWDNIVLPLPTSPAIKILGRSKHFLHCIGESHEGESVDWDSDRWVGKTCKIKTDIEKPNQYHKQSKAIVAEYVLEESTEPTEIPDDNTPF